MEDTLRVLYAALSLQECGVLILILMEDTLRATIMSGSHSIPISLNPYSNGRYSESYLFSFLLMLLNVLILILMEDTLRAYFGQPFRGLYV